MTLSTPTPLLDQSDDTVPSTVEEDEGPFLLPDSSWIAVVCGVSKEQWNELESDVDLPSGFFIAPRYVYMPDLMAAADVLLGKLVCLDHFPSSVADSRLRLYRDMEQSRNVLIRVLLSYMVRSRHLFPVLMSFMPLLSVSRPLFIEEYGLRLLLDHEGVGVELSRHSYEEGDWARAIEEAWAKGRDAKWRKREEGALGVGVRKREADGAHLAGGIVSWVKEWWSLQPEGGLPAGV
jgi:L-arabinokinase